MLKLIHTWIFIKYKAQLSIYDKGGSQHQPPNRAVAFDATVETSLAELLAWLLEAAFPL